MTALIALLATSAGFLLGYAIRACRPSATRMTNPAPSAASDPYYIVTTDEYGETCAFTHEQMEVARQRARNLGL